MFRFLFIFALLLAQSGVAQPWYRFDQTELRANAVYLVTRGTESKLPLIAEQFNTADRCSTHVALGVVENGKLVLFHVTNTNPDNQSAVVRESIERFTDLPDASYCSVWECVLEDAKVSLLREMLYASFRKEIAFDYDFNADDDDLMYCSEFCVKALRPFGFDYPLVEKALGALYQGVLGRECLRYWPVDFFEVDGRFRKVYEFYLR